MKTYKISETPVGGIELTTDKDQRFALKLWRKLPGTDTYETRTIVMNLPEALRLHAAIQEERLGQMAEGNLII